MPTADAARSERFGSRPPLEYVYLLWQSSIMPETGLRPAESKGLINSLTETTNASSAVE